MARRSDHTREELKDLILDTAWTIVGKKGAEGLTARNLATQIGYTPGTIYNIFKSMDDLYLQVNVRTLDKLLEVLNSKDCNDPKKSPAQNIKKVLGLYMEFAREYRPYWLMMFLHPLPEGRKKMGWYQEKIDRLFEPLENLLEPFFSGREKQKRKMAARVLWSSIHGLCLLQETGRISLVADKVPEAEMVSYLVDTFVAGIKDNK